MTEDERTAIQQRIDYHVACLEESHPMEEYHENSIKELEKELNKK